MLGGIWGLFREAVIRWIQQGFKIAGTFPSPRTGPQLLGLLDDLPGLSWVISSLVDRIQGQPTGQVPGASGWRWDEVLGPRARLGSAVLAQDKGSSLSDEVPISQNVLLGGKLGCHGEADDQFVLDSGWDKEELTAFDYFL